MKRSKRCLDLVQLGEDVDFQSDFEHQSNKSSLSTSHNEANSLEDHDFLASPYSYTVFTNSNRSFSQSNKSARHQYDDSCHNHLYPSPKPSSKPSELDNSISPLFFISQLDLDSKLTSPELTPRVGFSLSRPGSLKGLLDIGATALLNSTNAPTSSNRKNNERTYLTHDRSIEIGDDNALYEDFYEHSEFYVDTALADSKGRTNDTNSLSEKQLKPSLLKEQCRLNLYGIQSSSSSNTATQRLGQPLISEGGYGDVNSPNKLIRVRREISGGSVLSFSGLTSNATSTDSLNAHHVPLL